MKEIPEKGELIRFDHLRIKRGAAKHCTCDVPRIEIDEANSLVNCITCGALLDPLQALLKEARYMEAYHRQADAYWEQTSAMKEAYLDYQRQAIALKAEVEQLKAERSLFRKRQK